MSNTKVFIDLEFDSIRENGSFIQVVISIGAVYLLRNKFIYFYSLIKPKGFKKLTKKVKSITHLDSEDILNARSLSEVIDDFNSWLNAIGNDYTLYSFGPDDRSTLVNVCAMDNINTKRFEKIVNIQPVISKSITYKGKVIDANLSLDMVKQCYQIEGETMHNALKDAVDLMKVFKAYEEHKPLDESVVNGLGKRREEMRKQLEQERLHRLRMRMMQYNDYYKEIFFDQELLALFTIWFNNNQKELVASFSGITIEEEKVPYSQLVVEVKIDTTLKIPVFYLHIICLSKNKEYTFSYEVTKQNVKPIEMMFHHT